MQTALPLIAAALLGYLLGSIPSGVLWARVFGWGDPRERGSGHTGGLNAYRAAGAFGLIVVALSDILKGMAALWLATLISSDPWAIPLAGIAAVAGHNWPLWLNFRGGMGLATSAAVVGFSAILIPVIAGAVWLLLRPLIRHSPRSTVAMCAAVPVIALLLRVDWPTFALATGAAAIVGVRHTVDWNREYERPENPLE